MKAIETRYAGYRFRSRLEARWAVCFDQMGIKWEYEPQGYACTYRLTLDDGTFPYLPDFWFPDLELHGEVKGSLTHPELTRLLNAAASLSSNDGTGCHDGGGYNLIVFGNIPAPGDFRLPVHLHMHKGDLLASGWTGEPNGCPDGEPVAGDNGHIDPPDLVTRLLLYGIRADQWISAAGYREFSTGYTAARSARFEHGQHGG